MKVEPILELFFQRTRREKAMLLATLLVVCAWLFTVYQAKSRETTDRRAVLQVQREEQDIWLATEPRIREQMAELAAGMDEGRMFDANQLAEWADSMARRTGVQYTVSTVETSTRSGLRRHQLRVALDRISLERLINLVVEIDRERPYITLEELTIDPLPRTPDQLNVRLRLTSQKTIRPGNPTTTQP